ncbi:ABI gene family member 3 [Pelobates fuscus]|uniref:ABI gene family member 3 n=1 Tax=Pelobates fuscus TaxID=191477 RepID=UPI002FE4AF8F
MERSTGEVSTMQTNLKDHYMNITTARQALRDSYQNLLSVADYCETNYVEASDKQKALQDTMSLVTQTLASVASQVVIASRNVLCMLEEQGNILVQEEIKLHFMSQLLDIHSEKVSRHKIGPLTTRKRFPHAEKILSEEKPGRPTTYTRNPLNFKSLDNIGHGVMDLDSQFSKTGTMSRKASTKLLTQSQGSLGRSSRAKDVLPPLIPEGKFPSPSTPPILNASSPLSPVSPHLYNSVDDFPLPPPLSLPGISGPEFPAPLELNDFPPPMTYDMNGLWLPGPIEEETPSSLQEYSDSLPPPPDCEIRNGLWPSANVPDLQASYLDYLPPPPDF